MIIPRVGEVIARMVSWVTVDYRFLLWKFWKLQIYFFFSNSFHSQKDDSKGETGVEVLVSDSY